MVDSLKKPSFEEIRPGVKKPAQETLLTPRFYTTDFEEMAKILDLSESTIRVSLSRARKEVRGFMIKAHNYGIK